MLFNYQWNTHKSLFYKVLNGSFGKKSIATINVNRHNHRLLIWIAAYDTLNKRDQYIVYHLNTAKNICELSTPRSFVRIFIATCSHSWNTTDSLREFKSRNADKINYITNTSSSNDFILLEHFEWSCVEFMIGYYKNDLKLALPFAHRKYFQQHANQFDWFWYTEDDLLYDSKMYWNLVADTSFTLNTLSSTETNYLLELYAHKGRKPKLSSLGRYFFLPTLIRYEKPPNYEKNTMMNSIDRLDLWRLTDFGLCCQPLVEALIFLKEQWWLQPTNSHSTYYLLPREHLNIILQNGNWLKELDVTNRDHIASFWLQDYGYIRVASITNFDQYLVQHASSKYYDHPFNLPKLSTIIRELGFEYKESCFIPIRRSMDARVLQYTNNHESDIASCFPLFFSPLRKQAHDAVLNCTKLSNLTKIY